MLSFFKRLFVSEPPTEKIIESPGIPELDLTNPDDLARVAAQLLADPMLNDAFEKVGRELHRQWELSSPEDFEKQHTAHLSLLALKQVKLTLHSYIRNAAMPQGGSKYADLIKLKAQNR